MNDLVFMEKANEIFSCVRYIEDHLEAVLQPELKDKSIYVSAYLVNKIKNTEKKIYSHYIIDLSDIKDEEDFIKYFMLYKAATAKRTFLAILRRLAIKGILFE